MKQIASILGIIWLLNACTSPVDSQTANSAADCPTPIVTSLPMPISKDVDDRFDYHIRDIVADGNTIKFQTLKNDFVFCRGDNSWIVQPGTIKSEFLPPKNYVELTKELSNPSYKTIEFQGKTYQYRVITEPKPFLGESDVTTRPTVAPEKDKVVLELITPNSKEPQRQTLYTLKNLQQAAVKSGYSSSGVQLGFPRITATVTHSDRVWWSVAFEQGEGNGGVASIVGYDPQADKFTVIQPQELWWQQITDLAITGDADNPTFWIGTNISGEGNGYIPAQGLVAYRPNPQNPNAVTSYNVNNSPLVGAIPDKLWLEDDMLWVSTGNGVCKLKWQAADNPHSWSCWRFALMSKLPPQLPLYSSLTNKTPAVTLSSDPSDEIEVLWWMPTDLDRKGRYEVKYPQGFTVTVDEGAMLEPSNRLVLAGKPPIYWTGFEWHWHGGRFVRGFDEVASNHFGGGSQGISSNRNQPNIQINWNAMRGELDLLNLSPKSTSIKYYSGWVNEDKLNPYLTVLPQERPKNPQPNPLNSIAEQLQSP